MWYNNSINIFEKIHLLGSNVQMNVFAERKVDFLSKEAISKVLVAEAEANAIRERAESDARGRVEACEKACAEEQDAKLEAAADELDARLDTVRERAVTLIMQSREEADADIGTMRESARAKMREAVKHIEWELTDI